MPVSTPAGDFRVWTKRVGTNPDLKVLYLTGYSDRLFKEKVMLWEDEAFLDKPCSVKGLLQAVSMVTFASPGRAWSREPVGSRRMADVARPLPRAASL